MQERLRVEAEVMRLVHELAPSHTPRVLTYDGSHATMAVEFLGPPYGKVRRREARCDGDSAVCRRVARAAWRAAHDG